MTALFFLLGVAFGLILAGAWTIGMRMADDYRRRLGITRCPRCGADPAAPIGSSGWRPNP